MLIDTIIHDAWVICLSRIVHIEFIIYVTWYRHEMAHRICTGTSYEMGVSAWLKSTLRLVFDWVGSVWWDNVQQGRTVV